VRCIEVVRGNIRLDIDELGVEARVTITPDAGGAELSPEVIARILSERGIREGIDAPQIEKAFRTIAKKHEALTFTVAQGVPPRSAEAEGIIMEPPAVPEDLRAAAERVLSRAPPPEVYREREERFGPPPRGRRQRDGRPEKRIIRERIEVDPALIGTGFARMGETVGRVRESISAKDGRSIYGRIVPAQRIGKAEFLLGGNLKKEGGFVRAEVSGFIRQGENWADLVPYRDIEWGISVREGLYFLSFSPVGDGSPLPSATDLLAEAQRLGAKPDELLSEFTVQNMLAEAASSRTPIAEKLISISEDCHISVTVTPDKMRAMLNLKKGRGAGRELALADVSEAIKNSGVKGYNPEVVRKDILGFYHSTQLELMGYTLAVGQPAEKGEDARIEWRIPFLIKEEGDAVIALSRKNASKAEGILSLKQYPIEAVDSVGWVVQGSEVAKIVPAGSGKPGVDVFRTAIPGIKGLETRVALLENIIQRRNIAVAEIEGIVEKGTKDGVTFLRVRPHKDAELQVTLSPDRVQAFLTLFPAQGTGKIPDPEEVKETIEREGVVQGINSDAFLNALDMIRKNTGFFDLLIAEGRKPRGGADIKPEFHVQLATGRHLALKDDGKADYKNQDTITQVTKGDLIVSVPSAGIIGEDGWDVTGKIIPVKSREEAPLEAGKNVREEAQSDGGVKFYADADGELTITDGILAVRELHTVQGDVDLTCGNVKFKGKVHVKGSILSGFTVVAGDDVAIDEVVQAAFVSSDGSIAIGQGIKGEGRAVVRARKNLKAAFAEQAALIALGNIVLKNGCLRCQIKCNGRLILETEKGNLLGGRVKAKMGASVQNLGSPGGAHTEISFGQDYVVKDQIEKEEKLMEALKRRLSELNSRMKKLEIVGSGERQELENVRADKRGLLKEIEQGRHRLLGLRDKFEEHFPSQITVRGTFFPGAVVESHGRMYRVNVEKHGIVLSFDPAMGRIVEKTLM
jgi:uncharacterized protein (DUF342 family)